MPAAIEIQKIILNEEGLHARPAGIFAKQASVYVSKIELIYNQRTINAKSAMSLMTLGLQKGSQVILRAEGPDVEEALNSLSQLIDQKFQVLAP